MQWNRRIIFLSRKQRNRHRARTQQLTSEYRLAVKGDTVKADLPYYGRAYTAPIDPSKGGINFTSTNFDYSSKSTKKSRMVYHDQTKKKTTDTQQLILDISANGYGNLQVLSNNRQSISFSGYVRERNGKQQ